MISFIISKIKMFLGNLGIESYVYFLIIGLLLISFLATKYYRNKYLKYKELSKEYKENVDYLKSQNKYLNNQLFILKQYREINESINREREEVMNKLTKDSYLNTNKERVGYENQKKYIKKLNNIFMSLNVDNTTN